MKKYLGMAMIILMLFSLSGCKGVLEDAKESTIYIQASGDVFEAIIEDFDTKVYDKDDLKKESDAQIEEYNAKEERVKLTKLEVKDDVASALLSYATLDDYNEFNKVGYELSDLSDAKVEPVLYTVSDGSEMAFSKIEKNKDKQMKVLMVPEATNVKVDGTVLYVTKDVTVNKDKDTATTIQGDNYIIYEEQ